MDDYSAATPPSRPDGSTWKRITTFYENPSLGRSLWQVINTIAPYGVLWYVMAQSLAVSPWITLGLTIPTAGFLVRLFIIFHDCGHGSFFRSRQTNDALGMITGILTFTPYYQWRHKHAIHHATSGDLDRRGTGDVWTMTVHEYLHASRWRRLAYRLTRNPVLLFGVAPLLLLVIGQRFPWRKADRRQRSNVLWTNVAILAMAGLLASVMGLTAYLVVQATVLMIAGGIGVWLFYIQHHFEGVYWERRDRWDYATAALHGSSYYRLPKVLQWFTGNIGFHHIHHLSPRIPNYNLEACHNADPLLQSAPRVTLLTSLKSFSYRLWDEQQQTWVGYRHLKSVRRVGQ